MYINDRLELELQLTRVLTFGMKDCDHVTEIHWSVLGLEKKKKSVYESHESYTSVFGVKSQL